MNERVALGKVGGRDSMLGRLAAWLLGRDEPCGYCNKLEPPCPRCARENARG